MRRALRYLLSLVRDPYPVKVYVVDKQKRVGVKDGITFTELDEMFGEDNWRL
jgi:hypothetical protein